ncbi:hypothetical protein [Nocardia heshunensis]
MPLAVTGAPGGTAGGLSDNPEVCAGTGATVVVGATLGGTAAAVVVGGGAAGTVVTTGVVGGGFGCGCGRFPVDGGTGVVITGGGLA